MFRLSSLYDSEEGPTIATGVLAVGISLLFTVGLFLIINAHNSSQAQQLQLAVTAIKKSQDEGISLNQALAELKSASVVKSKPASTPTGPIVGTFDSLTVKGASDLQGGIKSQKDVSVAGKLTVKNDANILGNTNVGGKLTVGGDAVLQGDASVTGSTSVAGGLEVNGDVTTGQLAVADSFTLDSGLEVNGTAIFEDTLDLTGAATLNSSLRVYGATTLQDSLDVNNGTTTLNGGLGVAGATTLGAALGVTGAVNIDGSALDPGTDALDVTGATTLHAGLGVTGETALTGDLTVAGTVAIDGTALASGTPALNIIGATTIGTTLGITGGTNTLDFGTNSGVTVTGAATFTATTNNVTGDVTIAGATTLTATTANNITGNLTVGDQSACASSCTSTATLTGSLTLNGACAVDISDSSVTCTGISAGGALTINGGATLTSTTLESPIINNGVTVSGNLTTGADNAITVNGTFNSNGGGTTVNGDLTVGDADAGSLTAGGNLTVSGTIKTLGDTGVSIFSSATTGAANEDCTTVPNRHIRINRVTNGIVTAAVCVGNNDSVDGFPYYDLAENFPSVQSLSAGDVVSIDTANAEHVVKSSGANDKLAIGVVSTAPGYTLGSGGSGYPIALAGRVPVKVTDEGGAIAPGDYLTSSSTPGYAKKAAAGEKIIGQALAGLSGSSGTVMMFVNTTSGSAPQVALVQPAQSGAASFSSLNVSGPANLTDLTVSGQATVFNLTINGHIIGNDDTRGTVMVKAGDSVIHHDFTTAYDKAPVVVASPANHAVLYNVTPTAKGFDITLTAPAAADTEFSYLVQE